MDYEAFGPLKQASLGNGLSLGVDWGDDARLASRRLYKTADGTNLSLLFYAYDNDDNITAITDGVTPANDVAYSYDVRGRLSQVSLASTSAAPFKRTDYAHDANGNRTSVERRVNAADGSAAEADSYTRTPGTNRIASIATPAVTRTLGYDSRGNLATETRGAAVTATTAYDGHGRLTSYARTGDPSFVHSYNGLGDIAVRILEAVRLTDIGRSKLYELIASGDIETVKIGSCTLIPMASLHGLIERARKQRL